MPTQFARDSPYPATVQPGLVTSSNLPAASDYNRILFRAKAVWIVDIFPDELVIQEKTVSIIRNEFLVSYVETMPVKDIGRVVYIDTPFFAGIEILGKNTAHELYIKGIKKQQARQAKSILESLLLASASAEDMPHWPHEDSRHLHSHKK